MRILITGSNGQLAHDLIQLAQKQQHLLYSPTREQLDITQQAAVFHAIESFMPDVVINTAAYTQVDRAERDIQQAYAVNKEGVRNVALACAKLRCPLLHISTDYVFNGSQSHPYLETDTVSPINAYGYSKWQGEEIIRHNCQKHITLRVSSVFGVHGQNFVKTILRLAQEKEELRIVSDQIMCPTPASAIAATLLQIIHTLHWGTFHYCGSEAVSWYDFAKAIIQEARQHRALRVKQIIPITTAEFPTAAKRPAYSVLDCKQFENTFKIPRPNWRIGLTDVVAALSTA
jgi:dTDP-4-dehydrorhamnose reductase